MIIDDDYSQYEMFRIMNKAGVDAMARFEKDRTSSDKDAQLIFWNEKLKEAEAAQRELLTEETVYSREFAQMMIKCWENA